jgi:hypothetical protein
MPKSLKHTVGLSPDDMQVVDVSVDEIVQFAFPEDVVVSMMN